MNGLSPKKHGKDSKAVNARRRSLVFLFIASFLAASVLPLHGCGKNAYESQAPESLFEKAQLDMEAGRYEDAQDKLKTLLSTDAGHHFARSLLAAAYAAQAGLTMLAVVEKAAESQGGSGGSEGGQGGQGGQGGKTDSLTLMEELLPPPTESHIALLAQACAAMSDIPPASRTVEMKTQTGVFFTALSFLRINHLRANPDLLASLTPQELASILGNLTTAATYGGSNGPLTSVATSFQKQISQAPGTSEVDRFKTVISASSAP